MGAALQTEALQAALAGASELVQRTMRLFGIPESEIAETLRVAEREGVELDRLEVTTCLKRGEVEVVTRFAPDAQDAYEALEAAIAARHADTLFSRDGSTVDQQVAALLLAGRPGRRRAAADRHRRVVHWRPAGGAADRAARLLRVLQRRGRHILERGEGLPRGRAGRSDRAPRRSLRGGREGPRRRRQGCSRRRRGRWDHRGGGPRRGSEQKPVGLVWVSVTLAGADPAKALDDALGQPAGGRADVRERATTIAMHLVRRALTEAAGR